MLAAKNGEALNERTFGRQKSRINWPYPHGERREVMIATLRWAIVCRLFPMVRAFMQGGGRGKFPGREILFLAASAFKMAPFA